MNSANSHHASIIQDGASVVIVSYRTPALTERAVRSALASPSVRSVILVDNGSGDDTVARSLAIGDDRVVAIENDVNAGFGIAANIGAAQATGRVLIFLNSDAALRPESAERLYQAVISADGRAIVGPRLIGEDGAIQRSAGLVPRPDDLLVRGLGLHRIARALRRRPFVDRILGRSRIAAEYDLAVGASGAIDVSMVSGACFAIGRAAFAELGRFDERYFMYFEDADLCRRATQAGWPVRYDPAALVDHVGGASSGNDYHFGPRHATSMVRYLRDWHGSAGTATALVILWLRVLGHGLTLSRDTSRSLASLRSGLGVLRDPSRAHR